MPARNVTATGWRRPAGAALLIVLIAATLAILAAPLPVKAHAYLVESDPAANAVVPVAPAEVRIRFTEPLEPAFTRAVLYDAAGAQLETPPAVVGDDPYELFLPLPEQLPNGTYTVQWENISTADGHPAEGFFSFTIGAPADVAPVITAPASSGDGGSSGTLTKAGRWLGLLGIITAVGSLIGWYWVVRPAARTAPDEVQRRLSRRIAWPARGGVVVSLVGVALALVTQARDATGGLTAGNIVDFVRDSHTGEMLALRLGLLVIFGALLASRIPWEPNGGLLDALLAQGIGLGVLFQFALLTHATAQEGGEQAAVAAEWLHFVAAAVWIGGLLALAVALPGLRALLADAERRMVVADAVARFSTLAISAVIVVSLSGLYAGWVHLGSLSNLTGSDYGRTLLIKLALTVPLVALGALNLLVIGPALRQSVAQEGAFNRIVRVEIGLGAAVLLLAAILASTSPPQPAQATQTGSQQLELIASTAHMFLTISPGTVGQNQYQAEVHLLDGTFQSGSQALLRVARDDQISGTVEIELTPEESLDGTQPSARFQGSGTELSVIGDWQLELIVRRPRQADARAAGQLSVGDSAPAVQPAEPARRGFTSPLAAPLMLLAAAGIMVGVVGLRHRRGRSAGLDQPAANPTHSE